MLTELESLSQNIGKLISISQRHNEARQALEEQLAQARAEIDAAHGELAQVRAERDALQGERDSLSAKIDDAQVRLNAILEKLPRARTQAEPDNQLDLLSAEAEHEVAGGHHEANGVDTRHGDHA